MSDDIQQAADRFLSLMAQLRSLGSAAPPPQIAQVSPSLMAIIDFAATSPDCGVKEIAKGLKLSTPSVSVGVRHLEEAGLIDRRPHPRDKRAVQIFLTPQGQELYDQTYRYRRQMFERLLVGLSDEERETLLALLEKALTGAETIHTSTPTKGELV